MHPMQSNEVSPATRIPRPDEMMKIRGLQEIARLNLRRTRAEEAGIPALRRLIAVALENSGQSRICANFLLSLDDCFTFTFKLIELRNLDMHLWEDCMLILKLDQCPRAQIHCMIENGHTTWEELKNIWTTRLLFRDE